MPVPEILSVPAPIKPITFQLYTKILDIVFLMYASSMPVLVFLHRERDLLQMSAHMWARHTLRYKPSPLARFQPSVEILKPYLRGRITPSPQSVFVKDRNKCLHPPAPISSHLGEHGKYHR